MEKREKFSSRLGFILISAGCAIGLGNVWRFPYIAGKYGGAAFVLMYLFFLVIMGLPIMTMEFSVGRASQKSAAKSFHVLEPKGSKWHLHGYVAVAGNYLLMMFYTTVAGWMIYYFFRMLRGDFVGQSPEAVEMLFNSMLQEPGTMVLWMGVAVVIGFTVCGMGLRNGVERVTKVMMTCLLVVMVVLAIRSVVLPGAEEGLRFYLVPDFGRLIESGLWDAVFAALGQSFFTLSIGIGSMAIFGSYIDKSRSLMGEALNVAALDTFVAIVAGLIIFPACFAFGVNPGQGPGLVFVTLPNIFNNMAGGRLWGSLFFVFMSFAALSTVIAVFENIISFGMDLWGWSRRKTVLINVVLLFVLSLPCALGFNVLSGISFPSIGGIMDLEDFIVSNNMLPLGSIVYLMFCVSKWGWGWDGFILEADTGDGLKFPQWSRFYVTYVLPLVFFYIFIQGYWAKFFA